MLHESNHYVEVFKVAKEIFEQEDTPTNIKIVINETKRPSDEHSRRYNRPLSDEIAVLMPNDATNNRASTHPLEYRVRSTTLLAALFPHKVSLLNLHKYISLMIESQK